jgi:dimethylglycine dehydrogenase
MAQEDHFSFKRPRWFDAVGEECRALRSGVGLLDVSHFGKYEVKGPGAAAWLDNILANRLPKLPGKTVLTPMLNEKGGVIGDFTVTRLGEESFFMIGSGVAERYHWRWFNRFLPAEGVEITSMTAALAGFNLAGPKARDVLASLTEEDVSNEAFPFLTCRTLKLGGLEARAVRISFTGEVGYEIYLPEEDQLALFELLLERGQGFGIKPAGARALNSLRLEKGYGSWGREYSPEYSPYDSGLGWLVKLDKGDFVGRRAAERLKQQEPRYRLCCFAVAADDADAVGGEPVLCNGEVVGQVSSAAYGHSLGRSLALAYLREGAAGAAEGYAIEILGEAKPAELLAEPPYDPKGERLRG